MKIVLTSKGNGLKSKVDSRFGRCEYFILYNDENDDFEVIENKAKDMAHGAGVSAAQIVSDLEPDVIITGNVGPRAFQGLETAGIGIYGGADGTISEAIELFKDDKLEKLTGPTADRHENI